MAAGYCQLRSMLSNRKNGGVVASTTCAGQICKTRGVAVAGMPTLLARATATIAVFTAPAVLAQTPSPLGEWQYSAGIPLVKVYQRIVQVWLFRACVGDTVEPSFDGHDHYNR